MVASYLVESSKGVVIKFSRNSYRKATSYQTDSVVDSATFVVNSFESILSTSQYINNSQSQEEI